MRKLPTNSIVTSLLMTISTVLECGVLPACQASSRTFTVTGFTTLPVAMVYTSAMNAVRFPSIATSETGARGFVQRLVMQTIEYIPMNCPLVNGPEEDHRNIIMANWSKAMWQSVVDRAVRMLASGPFGTPFCSARATVGGN
ncbi:hypothetical protein KIN20_027288 [Parelaphostrongylus tenuis]|uniref:Uncharacterized protein n=1 Tax=Parelaphostrongylus tenuis TaxID=148309 RepID=A0AAD5QZJ6_PARTN|nr:hypothetical protein KIN20_027288 [Parelaphostrongylus tenuis]